ncbi:hypothetical protein ACO0LB_01355 [Undibacterium sp. SXout7W]|uniref:hypothetical protein n=1 Tax=Undibacterium sp. SXout7W TaxID=3413049 RepID=UPI003BF28519
MKFRLDEDTTEIIVKLAGLSGLTPDDLLDKLIASMLAGLYEVEALLEVLPKSTPTRDAALNLLQSFGHGETLTEGVKRLAPDGYLTLEQRFLHQIMSPIQRQPA